MKINLISDIHLEFGPVALPGGDVLILAGDICEAKNLKLDTDYMKYMWFFTEECAKYRHVIYVMGNHEHYGFKFEKTYDHIKSMMPANVHLLEDQEVTIDGVKFIGATLWTDLNKDDPMTAFDLQRSMNDYRVIMKSDKGVSRRLHPLDTAVVHAESLAYISEQVASAGSMPCVVVTHHAPSVMSTHKKYALDYLMNGGFRSDLDEFILARPQIKVWCHGHTHDPFDYMIGSTRVMCNPRGYSGYESRAREFDPTVGFDIEP